jgi:hypothetical protein
MCLLCTASSHDRDLERRSHVLRLLALVEHPDALPADAALRLAHEILRLTQTHGAIRRCEEVTPPAADSAAIATGRPS